MARATVADMAKPLDIIRRITGANYAVVHAYGQPRLELYDNHEMTGGCESVSPRLPRGELVRWLWAFVRGLRVGFALGVADGGA